ncbi:MAG TPA: Na(+)-translocating NADH-quinone reductase subunit C [Methylomirabilota bacterium]
MPRRNTVAYTLGFSAAVCLVCAVLVSSAAVVLRDRQALNQEVERKRNVLQAAGLAREGEPLTREEIERRFGSFDVVAVDLRTGEEDPAFETTGYDQQRALGDPQASRPVPPNAAQVARVPNHALVYRKVDAGGELELLVLPVEGKGLWSTMYGYLALGPDLETVQGLTYYQHGETPGLGGEVDNPRWKSLWPGRKIVNPEGEVAIEVIRGPAGPPATDPYRVDGLSGATITSRGVSATLRFWLGEHGFGPYLARLKKEGANGPSA